MRAVADTNVLVRLFVDDDPAQSETAMQALMSAETVVIGLQALCEFSRVLATRYQTGRSDIAAAIRQLLETANVVVNRPAVQAGLAVLDAGGDFADGIIAFEGSWLGGDTFVTFDKKASKILASQVQATRLLSA